MALGAVVGRRVARHRLVRCCNDPRRKPAALRDCGGRIRVGGNRAVTLYSLLYTSRSEIDHEKPDDEVNAIVAKSKISNRRANLTGALLFTGVNFAQVLEGRRENIDGVFARILRDPRHREIVIRQDVPILQRRFSGWSMAYAHAGRSTFVNRTIVTPMPTSRQGTAAETERLIRLIEEFVTVQG